MFLWIWKYGNAAALIIPYSTSIVALLAAALPASEARVCPVVGLAHVAVLPGHAPVCGGKDVN